MKFFGRKNKPEDEINKELNQVLKKLEVDSEIENKKIETLLEFITKTKKENIDFLNINLEELVDYLNNLQDEIREKIEFSSHQKSNKNIELSQELIKINKIISLLTQYSQIMQKDLKNIKISELINFALHRKNYLKELLDLK